MLEAVCLPILNLQRSVHTTIDELRAVKQCFSND